MKIGNPADKPPPSPPVAPLAPVGPRPDAALGATGKAAPQALDAPAEPSAQVDLSGTATTLMAGGTGADFDAEKVARVQQSIADGSFQVNAGAIADKLIANAQDVLNNSGSSH